MRIQEPISTTIHHTPDLKRRIQPSR